MNDLTPAQEAELGQLLTEFVQDRALDGLHCVVLLVGRSITKTAFSPDTAAIAPTILAAAYRAARDYNLARQN